MAKMPSQEQMLAHLERINWMGHVELPTNDLKWLCGELYAQFSGRHDVTVCDACGNASTLVAQTRLGSMCQECLEEAQDEIEEDGEALVG